MERIQLGVPKHEIQVTRHLGCPQPPHTLSLFSLWVHTVGACRLPSPCQLLSLEPPALPWPWARALPVSLPRPSPRLARWESPPGTQTWLAAVGLGALVQRHQPANQESGDTIEAEATVCLQCFGSAGLCAKVNLHP